VSEPVPSIRSELTHLVYCSVCQSFCCRTQLRISKQNSSRKCFSFVRRCVEFCLPELHSFPLFSKIRAQVHTRKAYLRGHFVFKTTISTLFSCFPHPPSISLHTPFQHASELTKTEVPDADEADMLSLNPKTLSPFLHQEQKILTGDARCCTLWP
jgi:hypothetical protein